MKSAIKVGSCVKMKSGGPTMTVLEINPSNPTKTKCRWFDNLKLKEDWFEIDSIQETSQINQSANKSISYDPNKSPEITRKLVEDSIFAKLPIANFICTGGSVPVLSFVALCGHLPSINEKIVLDEITYTVEDILYKVVQRENDTIMLVPNVGCVKNDTK